MQQLFYQEKMIKYTPFIQNYVFILLLLRIENLFIDPRLLVKKNRLNST